MRHVVDTTTRDTAVVVRGCAIVVPSLRNGDVFPVCDYRGQLSSEVRDFGIIYVVVAFFQLRCSRTCDVGVCGDFVCKDWVLWGIIGCYFEDVMKLCFHTAVTPPTTTRSYRFVSR